MGVLVSVFQLFVMAVMALYFLKELIPGRRTTDKADGKRLTRLRRMRRVSLSRPLSERARPRALCDMAGQADGLFDLKAALFGPYPKHVILYGPTGVGKTTAARLIFSEAKKSPGTPFLKNAPFIEMDASLIRYDERAIADPLIGSVHDPIYQGAGEKGQIGLPQIKEGAVTRAHGGILFLDEIGEMHPMEMMRLLKVMEDRRVKFESAYFDQGLEGLDPYTLEAFKKGLPADFRLIAATTRSPFELPAALRSRAVEIVFSDLTLFEKVKIVQRAAECAGVKMTMDQYERIAKNASGGRDCINLLEMMLGAAAVGGRKAISEKDIEWAVGRAKMKNAAS